MIWVDGASKGNPGPAKANVVFENGEIISKDLGKTTNNRAEYSALILALKTVASRGLGDVIIMTDSQLIDGHINKGWKVYENQDLVDEAKSQLHKLKKCRIVWIPREENKAHADE
jgi:ribonuclease HI